MDVHDRRTRSFNMSRIRSRDTKPEVRLRRYLWACGLRGYRLRSNLPGKPDIVFSKNKLAIFVDGCFWHGCPGCGDGRAPTSNISYWTAKRTMNRQRDKRYTLDLEARGWKVLRLWEHEVNKQPEDCVVLVEKLLGQHRTE